MDKILPLKRSWIMLFLLFLLKCIFCEYHTLDPNQTPSTRLQEVVSKSSSYYSETWSQQITQVNHHTTTVQPQATYAPADGYVAPYVSQVLCGLENASNNQELNEIYHTQTTYPLTFVPDDDNEVPVTLAVNNYVYTMKNQPANIFHSFQIKIINSPFTGVYKMFVPNQPFESFYQINTNEFNHNEGTLNHTYSCSQQDSCLLTGLLQYQMIFVRLYENGKQEKDYDFYDFYIGNCDDNEVEYDQFNNKVSDRCIPFEMICLDPSALGGNCNTAIASDYINYGEANLDAYLTQDSTIKARGYYPDPSFDACRSGTACDYLKTKSKDTSETITKSSTSNFSNYGMATQASSFSFLSLLAIALNILA